MSSSQPTPQDLEERLLKLSVATIKLLKSDKQIPQNVKTQFIRSVTSIGANYMEANNASSKADFRNKVFIAKKETAESIYWVKIIEELSDKAETYDQTMDELNQFIRIFQKIVSTIDNGSSNEK